MKTTIKENEEASLVSSYSSSQLENGDELEVLIQEAEKLLLPCLHCGGERIRILYSYRPDYHLLKKYVHELYAVCHKRGCEIQSKIWYAEDDEADFKEALRLIVEAWNRRPEDSK